MHQPGAPLIQPARSNHQGEGWASPQSVLSVMSPLVTWKPLIWLMPASKLKFSSERESSREPRTRLLSVSSTLPSPRATGHKGSCRICGQHNGGISPTSLTANYSKTITLEMPSSMSKKQNKKQNNPKLGSGRPFRATKHHVFFFGLFFSVVGFVSHL